MFALVDVNTANSLSFFLENDLSQFQDIIEQYFTSPKDTSVGQSSGQNEVELVPGGANKKVTNENKHEFVRKKCHFIAYLQQKN
mmetsp:Transcript_96669/g.133164  ORF Transcript_96669/g.133164 Transcript_96669/m.133164 type:complete len:84 (+) Transcript_96669:804-1055(+)